MSHRVNVAWPALKAAAIKLYDHLGIAMVLSLLWLIVGVFPLLLAIPLLMEAWLIGGILLLVIAAVLFVPATCATFAACGLLLNKEDAGIKVFFRAFGKYFRDSFLVGLLDGLLFWILAVDLVFALQSANRFFQFMGGIWLWFGVFLLLVQMHLIPLLLADNSVKSVFKKAALLVMDNLGSTLGIAVETVALLLLSLLVPPLFVLFFPVMIAFLHLNAYEIIMTKYDEVDPDAT